MKQTLLMFFVATALTTGLVATLPVFAQTSMGYEKTQPLERYREMSALMQDMTKEMTRMQDQMTKSGITPAQYKQMAQGMKEMSAVLRRMAGLADRPSMSDKESQKEISRLHKEMASMRERMDQVMKEPAAAPAKR